MSQASPQAKSTATGVQVGVDRAVLEAHPGTQLAILALPAATYSHPSQADEAERAVVTAVGEAFPEESDLKEAPEDSAYREFYRAMGLKAAQVSTPVKQALRVQRSDAYRSRGLVVDTAMAIEYSTLVSFQVYSADRVTGPLCFSLALGEEPITTMRGEHKTCKTGELLLLSGDDVMHSCYYGNDPRFLLQDGDAVALIRVMRVPGLSHDRFEGALAEVGRRLDVTDTVLLNDDAREGLLSLDPEQKGGAG